MGRDDILANISLIEDALKAVGVIDEALGGMAQRATDAYRDALEAEAETLRSRLG